MRRALEIVDRALYRGVSVLVVALLLAMVGLSFTQVLLRNLAGAGIAWAEIVLQHMVLAVGMFGAVLAAHQGRQISIDILSRIASPTLRRILGWVAGLFTITVTGALARVAWIFVASEREFGTELYQGLPAWIFQSVIPAGFALIGLQVLLNLLLARPLSDTSVPETSELDALEPVNGDDGAPGSGTSDEGEERP